MDFTEVKRLLQATTKGNQKLYSTQNIEFYTQDGFLILAGSNEFFDWSYYNLDFRLTRVGDYHYHRGFYRASRLFCDVKWEGYVGYSLGGAIATILGIEYNRPSWTINAPNIGFTGQLEGEGKHWRHNSDPIKFTPYRFPYEIEKFGKKTFPNFKYHLI